MRARALPAIVVVLLLACGQPTSVPAPSAAPTPSQRPSLQYATVEATSQPAGSVIVGLTNYAFVPANISVKAGRVVLYLVNSSNESHSMSLRDEAGPFLAVSAQSTVVLAGHTAVFTIEDLPAGTYDLKEPLAGLHHSNETMVGVLIASMTGSSPVAIADAQMLQCGVFNGSEHTSATTVYLLVPSTGSSALRFTWPGSLRDQPAVGSYMCARFKQAAANVQGTDPPTNVIFVSIVAAGEPGYITRP